MNICDWPTYIKDIRTRLGLTQRQFGNAIGAGVPTVSRWENGVVTPSPAYQRLIREFEEKRQA
jgi:DNA-binding transcriptional regulator YiaG